MKKIFFAIVSCVVLASCGTSVTVPLAATSNPVGNKCGEASYKYTIFGGKRNADIGIEKAAKNAGITKISHVDQNVKKYGFIIRKTKVTTRVYGE